MKCINILLIGSLLIAGCGEEEGDFEVESKPTVPVDTLEVTLQIGTDFGDSTDTFGAIMDVAIDDNGNILVLDRVAADLKMYDSSGEYLGHVTRRGNGPGELVLPWDMFLFGDGRLMVLDPGKHGFIVFDDSLRFKEELQLWLQNPPFQSCAVSDSQFASYKANLERTDTQLIIHRRVALYTYGNEDWDMLFWRDSLSLPIDDVRRDRSLLFNNIEEPLVICSDGSGMVYFSMKEEEEYSVTGWDIDGEKLLDISMDMPPVEKTMEEIKAESTYVTNYVARIGGGREVQWEFQPELYKDMVIDINIGPDGNLWVRRGTKQTPFFDIFDPSSGELLRQAVFPEEGLSWKVEISRNGILAWEEDPESGFQVLYFLK